MLIYLFLIFEENLVLIIAKNKRSEMSQNSSEVILLLYLIFLYLVYLIGCLFVSLEFKKPLAIKFLNNMLNKHRALMSLGIETPLETRQIKMFDNLVCIV